jgi:hypothetical protein
MRRLFALALAASLVLSVAAPVTAAPATLKFKTLPAGSVVAFDIHTATDGTLGGTVKWSGSISDSGGYVVLEIVMPEVANCSIGGIVKPLWCYVGAPAFEKGGFAPAGWYHVEVRVVGVDLSNATITMSGDIDSVLGP